MNINCVDQHHRAWLLKFVALRTTELTFAEPIEHAVGEEKIMLILKEKGIDVSIVFRDCGHDWSTAQVITTLRFCWK